MVYKTLKDIAKITMGQSPDSSSYNEDHVGLPFFQGNADFGDLYPTERIWCSEPKKTAKPNDILISVRAPIGALNMANSECCIGRGLAAITIEDPAERNYVYHLLKAKNQDLISKGTGSTFKAIGKSVIEDVQIPQISKPEQELCMKTMDLLESIIRERQSQLTSFDDLIKARFVELFGDVATGVYKYETHKLGEVAAVGSSHRVFTSEFVDKGIPFYRGTEIGELANGQIPSNPYYISEEHYYRLANDETKPKIGDLLMPSICNKGQVWMVDTEEPFYYKDGRVLCISADREIYDSKFLQYFMRAKTEVEYPKMGSGSTFAEFKIFLLKDFDILTPPMNLQKQFSSFVQQVDKSKSVVQKSLEEAQLLFDSLMQQHFG